MLAARWAGGLMLVCLFTAAGASAPAIEDNAVLVWNEEALNAIRLARNPPPIAAIHLATFHAAVHDAVIGVTRSDRTWLPVPNPAPDTSAEAAAAGAAHLVLRTLWSSWTNPFGLSLSRSPGDQHLARELARTALTQHHDARSGLFWAFSEEGTASLPWRPLALPSPIRAESLALAIGIDPGPREQLRRALRHTIEFDPLPPAEILIALTRDAESAP
jgi:hypothetical protein